MQESSQSSPRAAEIWESQLEEAREKIGTAPRAFSSEIHTQLTQRTYFAFLDSLGAMLKRREELLQNGIVVWACIVRGEAEIFQPGSRDIPADVVFCPDAGERVNPTDLMKIAAELRADRGRRFKNVSYNQALEYLESSHGRAFGLKFSAGSYRNLMLSTILIERKYFPGSMMSTHVFPVLVLEDGAAMVLPDLFWPRDLLIYSNEKTAEKYPYFWQRLHIPEKLIGIVIVVVTLIIVIALIVVQR